MIVGKKDVIFAVCVVLVAALLIIAIVRMTTMDAQGKRDCLRAGYSDYERIYLERFCVRYHQGTTQVVSIEQVREQLAGE